MIDSNKIAGSIREDDASKKIGYELLMVEDTARYARAFKEDRDFAREYRANAAALGVSVPEDPVTRTHPQERFTDKFEGELVPAVRQALQHQDPLFATLAPERQIMRAALAAQHFLEDLALGQFPHEKPAPGLHRRLHSKSFANKVQQLKSGTALGA